jgi:hypothetical protein
MIKKILTHRLVSGLSLSSFVLVAGGFIWSAVVLSKITAEPWILHFNDLDGITATGGLTTLIFMGILSLAIVCINFFIAMALDERDKVLGKIVASMTLLVAVLLFLAFVAILNVN